MNKLIFLTAGVLLISISCSDRNPSNSNNLNCIEYWDEVSLANFCGLTTGDFEYNTIPQDICNADQGSTYTFDDLVSIRVYNHFSKDAAQEEYDGEVEFFESATGFTFLNNVGDEAFGVITTEFNKLNFAIIQVIKDNFTIYLEVNGNTANGSNNCFDENSVVEFAKALTAPL
ncbi:MAG: hypothetical protein DWQ02_05670 [Bacteroidetes bacterium]|nr:MAG: hypothetical protein DWQ02_05670 [Bacteroidota bacterium]